MNAPKKCAKPSCGKTVYPMEELKCLDKASSVLTGAAYA